MEMDNPEDIFPLIETNRDNIRALRVYTDEKIGETNTQIARFNITLSDRIVREQSDRQAGDDELRTLISGINRDGVRGPEGPEGPPGPRGEQGLPGRDVDPETVSNFNLRIVNLNKRVGSEEAARSKQITNLNKRVSNEEAARSKQITNLNKRVSNEEVARSKQITNLEEQDRLLRIRIVSNEEEISKHQRKLQTHEDTIVAHQGLISDNNDAISGLRTKSKENNDSISRHQRRLQSHESIMENLAHESQLKALGNKIYNFLFGNPTPPENTEPIVPRIVALEQKHKEDIDALSDRDTRNEVRIVELDERVKETERIASETVEWADAAQRQIDWTMDKAENNTKRIDQLSSEIEDVEENIIKNNQNVESTIVKLEELVNDTTSALTFEQQVKKQNLTNKQLITALYLLKLEHDDLAKKLRKILGIRI